MGKFNNDLKHFKRQPVGKREEFNEEILYELYKEKPFDNSQEIRGFILKHHGVYASTNLITKIINYQVRKYGCRKSSGADLVRTYLGKRKSSRRRQKEKINRQRNSQTTRFIKRTSKRRHEDGNNRED